MPNADDLLGLLLAYEVYSAISRRCPLLTELCREYPILTVAVLAVAFRHLQRLPIPTIGAQYDNP